MAAEDAAVTALAMDGENLGYSTIANPDEDNQPRHFSIGDIYQFLPNFIKSGDTPGNQNNLGGGFEF